MFYDPRIISPININSVRSIYFCVHQFRKMKLLLYDKFHCRADAANYIWLNAVPNIFDFYDILSKIHKCKYTVQYIIPRKNVDKILMKILIMVIVIILMHTCGYGAKYHGFIRCLPNSIISIFFIRVTTSS